MSLKWLGIDDIMPMDVGTRVFPIIHSDALTTKTRKLENPRTRYWMQEKLF